MDKIDIEGFKRDLGKFREHYPETAVSFWCDWIDRIDKLATLPEEWGWLLEVIQTAEKIRPSTIDQSVPGHLQALLDKETQPIKQTRVY